MSDKINVVILAAGKGTRLKIDTAKPLCLALGKPLIGHVISSLEHFTADHSLALELGIVVGHQKDEVKKYIRDSFDLGISFAEQKEQLGTGHALQQYFEQFSSAYKNEFTIVTCADTPLIDAEIYGQIFETINKDKVEAVCASFEISNPFGYGRIIKEGKGFKIVEQKDASLEEARINEVNSALYIFKTAHIKNHINNLNSNNKSGEFYLTDLFKPEYNVKTQKFLNSSKFLGVNTLVQLAEVEELLQKEINDNHMLSGVQMIKPATIRVCSEVSIGLGTLIYPNVCIEGNTVIGENVVIESGVTIKNSIVEVGTIVKAGSYLEGAKIESNCAIGPMARLREKTIVGKNCKLGNFVETKKVELKEGVKISHLSYVGDAKIGANTNIGCGFITCNYDGAQKHETVIGEDCFIGSDCQMIAPITIGDRVFIGSGSTINKNVQSDAFAIARQRQEIKPDMAKNFLKSKDS